MPGAAAADWVDVVLGRPDAMGARILEQEHAGQFVQDFADALGEPGRSYIFIVSRGMQPEGAGLVLLHRSTIALAPSEPVDIYLAEEEDAAEALHQLQHVRLVQPAAVLRVQCLHELLVLAQHHLAVPHRVLLLRREVLLGPGEVPAGHAGQVHAVVGPSIGLGVLEVGTAPGPEEQVVAGVLCGAQACLGVLAGCALLAGAGLRERLGQDRSEGGVGAGHEGGSASEDVWGGGGAEARQRG